MRTGWILLAMLLWMGCRPETYTPKKRGYYLVHLPEHRYRAFDWEGYPYRFEYPVYAKVTKDTVFFGNRPENPYWLNMSFPALGGQLRITYKEIGAGQQFDKLMEDAYRMSSFHNKVASYIVDHRFRTAHGVNGIVYNVGGNAATSHLFFATDSVRHFIWGALYFDVTPNADSLAPITDFIVKDIDHLVETLEWK